MNHIIYITRALQFIAIIQALADVWSLVTTPKNTPPQWQKILSKFMPQNDAITTKDARSDLKQLLYEECSSNLGKCDEKIRNKIQGLIDDLTPMNPTKSTATSPLLMRKWKL
jgi:hypothetical protein